MLPDMSVEGGMSGHQKRFLCPNCGRVFFAWRPDTHPGQKIKCYFCKKEIEDEAARRAPAPAPAATAAAPAPEKKDTAPA